MSNFLHNFYEDNKGSVKYSDEADKAYHRLYRGHIRNIEFMDFSTEKGKKAQLEGIDKILYLDDGREIKVDEKTHAVSYGITMEFWSNVERKTPGWLFTSTADYIAQIEPRKDEIIYISMNTMRDFVRAHITEWKQNNKMRYQQSTKDGKYWHSAAVTVKNKEFIDWVKSKPNLEQVQVLPLHVYE